MQAIILAGGKGRRLLPFTTVLPKPLMPIGDYPILEIILRQLKNAGIEDITISTGYLHELICAYLQSRSDLDIRVKYSHEKVPLGTIAPLLNIKDLGDDFLVMNGDILTDLDYRAFLAYHQQKKGIATIATYSRDVYIDFGVMCLEKDTRISRFVEKPTQHFDVSMGVYAFNKKILDLIPREGPFGFDHLMYALMDKAEKVYSYRHDGYWLDIGRPDDYAKAIEEFEKNTDKFLK
jgi:NDP-sugar pyrophosphorylase family protein